MKRLCTSLCTALILTLGVSATPEAIAADKAEAQKAILVTGASSGIGRRITEVLAENGYFVYAGARKQADMDALNELDNVQAVRLDVTVQSDIDAAVKTVRAGGKGLYGLVNNAGVAIGGPLIEVDEAELKWLFDVNVFGPYRITQAFAPLVIEQKGRITTIGSISGILSGTFFGQYSMSKHAIEAYTDSLASELEDFGVHVSVIEPGNYQTEIGKTAKARMREKRYAQEGSRYYEAMKQWLDSPDEPDQYKPPDEVAAAAMRALFDPEPKRRYLVVPAQIQARWTIAKQIEELVQLNEDHEYSYSRDELVAMLDEALDPSKE